MSINVKEGGIITATVYDGAYELDVSYLSGSASPGIDFESISKWRGLGGASRNYKVYDDDLFEGNETVSIFYWDPHNHNSWFDTYNIIDNDKPEFTLSFYEKPEMTAAGTLIGAVIPTNIKTSGVVFSTSTAGYQIKGNEIYTTAAIDYEKGSDVSIAVTARHGPTGITNTHTGTFHVSNINSEYSVSNLQDSVIESESGSSKTLSYKIERSGDTQAAQDIAWIVKGASSADVPQLAGQVTFGIGETSKVVSLQLNGNDRVEPDRTVTLTIGGSDRDISIKKSAAEITIFDDDEVRSFDDISKQYPELASKSVGVLENVGSMMFDATKNAAEYAAELASDLENGVPSYIDEHNLELIEGRLSKFADSFKKIDGVLDEAVGALGSQSANLISKGTHISATALGKLLPVMDGLTDATKVLDQGGSVQDAWLRGIRSASVAILSGEVGTIAGGIAIGAAATLGAAPIAAAVVGATVSIGAAWVIGETVNGALNFIEPLEGKKPVPMSTHSFSFAADVNSLSFSPNGISATKADSELLVFNDNHIDKAFTGAKWSFDPKTYEFKWLDEATRYKFEQTAAALDLQQEVLQKIPDMQASVSPTSAAYEFFAAGAGNDIITGSVKTDVILSKDGNDRVFGGEGADIVFGGKGADILIGGAGDDRLLGQDGADTLIGQVGEDVLNGGAGADYMWGGEGNDTYYVDDYSDRISDDNGQGIDTVYTSIDYSLSSDILYSTDRQEIENLHANAGSKGLSLHGNWLSNKIYSGAGNDQMDGFVGDDTYYVNSQEDHVFEGAYCGYDTVRTDVDYALQLGQEIELLTCSELSNNIGLRLTGNEFDNKFIGGSGANVFEGGQGNDIYVVMNDNDMVIEGGDGYGVDTVEAYMSWSLTANVENLTLKNSGVSDAIGNELANVITGNDSSNVINGKLGNDILLGLAGDDTFKFDSEISPSNIDHIVDFTSGSDQIVLEKALFSNVEEGYLAEYAFKDLGSSNNAVDADDRVLYDSNSGKLFYDVDGNGVSEAVQFATLDNHAVITHKDITVVASGQTWLEEGSIFSVQGPIDAMLHI